MTRTPRGERRLTLRMRLTLSYAGLVGGVGLVMIGLVYAYMRLVPMRLNTTFAPPAPDGQSASFDLVIPVARSMLNTMLVTSLLVLTILTLLSGLVGWIVAGRVMAPLVDMKKAAALATSGDYSYRLNLKGPDDEVRELGVMFDAMLDSVDQSLRSQQQFAANASHELRTPLATTQTMIDVTLSDPDATTQELRDLLRRVRETNHANAQTVDALLDLSAAQGGMLAREKVDLAEIVRQAIHEVESLAKDHGIAIHTSITPAAVTGDQVLLRQAVSNLLRNAVTYNQADGSVNVALQVHHSPYASASCAVLNVTNTGPLVDADTVSSLCEPFVRGSRRTAGTTRGHGLGLAIVQAVAQAHRGRVTISALDEGGLSVTLTVPATARIASRSVDATRATPSTT